MNQKMKIMASGPITSWQIDGETVETRVGFIFGATKSLQMVIAAMKLSSSCGARGGFLPRHDEDLREPLMRRQGSQVSMRVARGSASWLSSHGRGASKVML